MAIHKNWSTMERRLRSPRLSQLNGREYVDDLPKAESYQENFGAYLPIRLSLMIKLASTCSVCWDEESVACGTGFVCLLVLPIYCTFIRSSGCPYHWIEYIENVRLSNAVNKH